MDRRKFLGVTAATLAAAGLGNAARARDTDFIYACGTSTYFDGKKRTTREGILVPHPNFKVPKGEPKIKTLFNGKPLEKDWFVMESNVEEGWILVNEHKNGYVRKYGKVQILHKGA